MRQGHSSAPTGHHGGLGLLGNAPSGYQGNTPSSGLSGMAGLLGNPGGGIGRCNMNNGNPRFVQPNLLANLQNQLRIPQQGSGSMGNQGNSAFSGRFNNQGGINNINSNLFNQLASQSRLGNALLKTPNPVDASQAGYRGSNTYGNHLKTSQNAMPVNYNASNDSGMERNLSGDALSKSAALSSHGGQANSHCHLGKFANQPPLTEQTSRTQCPNTQHPQGINTKSAQILINSFSQLQRSGGSALAGHGQAQTFQHNAVNIPRNDVNSKCGLLPTPQIPPIQGIGYQGNNSGSHGNHLHHDRALGISSTYNDHIKPYLSRRRRDSSQGSRDSRSRGSSVDSGRRTVTIAWNGRPQGTARNSIDDEDESLKVKVTDGIHGSQEYDPADPTEDEGEASGPDKHAKEGADFLHKEGHHLKLSNAGSHKRSRSPVPEVPPSGDLHVTIDSQGRYVSKDTEILKQAKKRSLLGEDPQGNNSFLCHACNTRCHSIQDFDLHMNSNSHKQRMQDIYKLQMKTQEQQQQQHLAPGSGKDAEREYCKVCDRHFNGSIFFHKRTDEHKRKDRLTRKGCILCKTGSFHKYPEYVAHIDSSGHKQRMKKQERPFCRICDMVFRSPKKYVLHCNTSNHRKNKEQLAKDLAARLGQAEQPADAEHPQNPSEDGSVEQTFEDIVQSSDLFQHENDKVDTVQDEDKKSGVIVPQVDQPASSLTFDPHSPIGTEYVIPVRGFFCKLCQKFYSTEKMARQVHCVSEKHFENYQKVVEAYQKQQEQRLQVSTSADLKSGAGPKNQQHSPKSTKSETREATAKHTVRTQPAGANSTAATIVPPKTKNGKTGSALKVLPSAKAGGVAKGGPPSKAKVATKVVKSTGAMGSTLTTTITNRNVPAKKVVSSKVTPVLSMQGKDKGKAGLINSDSSVKSTKSSESVPGTGSAKGSTQKGDKLPTKSNSSTKLSAKTSATAAKANGTSATNAKETLDSTQSSTTSTNKSNSSIPHKGNKVRSNAVVMLNRVDIQNSSTKRPLVKSQKSNSSIKSTAGSTSTMAGSKSVNKNKIPQNITSSSVTSSISGKTVPNLKAKSIKKEAAGIQGDHSITAKLRRKQVARPNSKVNVTVEPLTGDQKSLDSDDCATGMSEVSNMDTDQEVQDTEGSLPHDDDSHQNQDVENHQETGMDHEIGDSTNEDGQIKKPDHHSSIQQELGDIRIPKSLHEYPNSLKEEGSVDDGSEQGSLLQDEDEVECEDFDDEAVSVSSEDPLVVEGDEQSLDDPEEGHNLLKSAYEGESVDEDSDADEDVEDDEEAEEIPEDGDDIDEASNDDDDDVMGDSDLHSESEAEQPEEELDLGQDGDAESYASASNLVSYLDDQDDHQDDVDRISKERGLGANAIGHDGLEQIEMDNITMSKENSDASNMESNEIEMSQLTSIKAADVQEETDENSIADNPENVDTDSTLGQPESNTRNKGTNNSDSERKTRQKRSKRKIPEDPDTLDGGLESLPKKERNLHVTEGTQELDEPTVLSEISDADLACSDAEDAHSKARLKSKGDETTENNNDISASKHLPNGNVRILPHGQKVTLQPTELLRGPTRRRSRRK